MDDEWPQKPRAITPQEFSYNPDVLDICTFGLQWDHAQLKAACKLAHDRGTSLALLNAFVWEQLLTEVGYLDPSTPKGDLVNITVTVRDLRNNPKAIHTGVNRIAQPDLMVPGKSDEDLEEDLDDLLEDL